MRKWNQLWEHVQNSKTKIAKRVFDFMNEDRLSEIVIDGNVYWIELTMSHDSMPNYIHKYIKRFMKKQGYQYLYDI